MSPSDEKQPLLFYSKSIVKFAVFDLLPFQSIRIRDFGMTWKNLLRRILSDSSGLSQYSPLLFFKRPKALFLLLLKILINFETSDGVFISDVNLFHPSSLAFFIAVL